MSSPLLMLRRLLAQSAGRLLATAMLLTLTLGAQGEAGSWQINLKDAELDAFISEVARITGKNFVIDDAFKLDNLLALELHNFEDDVGEIVNRAQKEEKMEQALKKISST